MLSRKAGILKGWIAFFSLIFCVVFRITSQEGDVESPLEVAVEEINQEIDTELVFKSYTGDLYSFTNTAKEIRNLGKTLSDALGDDSLDKKILDKYSIMEITNEKDDDLYSAAIISLDIGSRVDHIRNLRQILAGFLQARYDYKGDEADTLAYFLSFYNARYRGDIEYLKSVYKPEVFKHITAENAGVSLDYHEWPGKSRLIIPLTHESLVSLSQLGKEVMDLTREKGDNLSIKERDSLQTLRKKDVEQREESKKQKEEKITELQDVLAKKESEVSSEKSKVAEKNLAAEKKRLEAGRPARNNRQGGILEKIDDRKQAQRAKDYAALGEEDVKKKEESLVETRTQLDKQKKDKARDEKENKKILSDHDDEERQLKEDKLNGTINPQVDQQKKPAPAKPVVPPKPAPAKKPVVPLKPAPAKKPVVPLKPAPAKPVVPLKPAPAKKPVVPLKPAPAKKPVVPLKPAPAKKPVVPLKPAPAKPVPPKPAPDKPEQSKSAESDGSSESLMKDGKLYYMNISAGQKLGHYNNKIDIIDTNKSEVVMSSNDDICSVHYMSYQGGVLVIRSHEKNHEGHHSLSILDLETLTPVLETPDDVNIHWDTPLSIINGKIYSMISVDGKIYLARFNQELKLELTSSIEVNESTSMVIVKDRIYANNKGAKSITIFDKDNLSKIGEISIK